MMEKERGKETSGNNDKQFEEWCENLLFSMHWIGNVSKKQKADKLSGHFVNSYGKAFSFRPTKKYSEIQVVTRNSRSLFHSCTKQIECRYLPHLGSHINDKC